MKNNRVLEQLAGAAAVVLLIGGCLYILTPFFAPLLWAAIISYSTWDIYQHQVKLLRGRRVLSAILMNLIVLMIIVAPFAYAAAALVTQGEELQHFANKLIEKGMPPLPQWIANLPFVGTRMTEIWSGLLQGDPQILAFIRDKLAAPVGQWLLTLGASTGKGLLQLVFSIFLSFFFYVGGQVAVEWLQAAVKRIAPERGTYLLQLAGSTVKGVVYGILGTALVQAVLAGFAYWIAGVPNAGIWGFATYFASVLPVAGSALVWVPAALWLYTQGEIGWAIFLVVWGILVVSSVDNFIRPMLISKDRGLPFIIVLLGVLGGLFAFGFLGVFIGPTLLAVGYSVLHDWTVGPGHTEDALPADPKA